MSKNLLSENMLRFGTKNLSERQQRELVVKSIMETINQHGLHGEVRRRLTEADAPSKKNWAFEDDVKWQDAKKLGVKFRARTLDPTTGSPTEYGPLVYQSDTSVTEASTVLQGIIKVLGTTGTSDPAALAAALKKINANNYYALLWKVRYGSSFRSITKSNGYNTVTDWISKKSFDIPSAPKTSTSDDSLNPVGTVRNWFQDPTIFNAVNRLTKYNTDEGRKYADQAGA